MELRASKCATEPALKPGSLRGIRQRVPRLSTLRSNAQIDFPEARNQQETSFSAMGSCGTPRLEKPPVARSTAAVQTFCVATDPARVGGT